MSMPDVAAARKNGPKSKAEWEASITKMDVANAALALALAKKFAVTVKRNEIAGVTVRHVVPAKVDLKHRKHLFIHYHDGAYVIGGGDAGVREAILIAGRVYTDGTARITSCSTLGVYK